MNGAGARPIAPSTRLVLYLSALIAVYVVKDAVTALVFGGILIVAALAIIAGATRPVPRARWKAAVVFVSWVFVMRAALDLVGGAPLADTATWLAAGRQAIRVAVLAIGVIALLSVTTARDVVDELERSRLPRSARLLVMMLVQYPRVLRDRYEQIVEAQVARGANRPRSIVQRATHGAALLLPVMQSELNAIGERASLLHLRGLDLEVAVTDSPDRTPADVVVIGLGVAILATAVALRLMQ